MSEPAWKTALKEKGLTNKNTWTCLCGNENLVVLIIVTTIVVFVDVNITT